MDRASNSSASNSSEGRIAANVAHALAQVAQQAQAGPVVNLIERERAIQQAALRLLALLPPAGGGLNLPGGLPESASLPLLIGNPQDWNMRLPKEVWQLIFHFLDETSLARVRQSCKSFYHAGKDLHLNYLNPQSELGKKQRDICKTLLKSIVAEHPCPSRAIRRSDYQPNIRRFKQALQAFASHYRCVEVSVPSDYEQAAVDALKDARGWQSLHLRFSSELATDADVMKVISRLGQALSAQRRKVELDLKIDREPESWPTLLCEAFTLTGLHLDLDGVDIEALANVEPLKDLLSGRNSLDCFEFNSYGPPDPILPWLTTGSHDLTSLILYDIPEDGQLLRDVLRAKPKLSSLALGHGIFKEGGLTLAQVLQAAPGLKILSLHGATFQPGGSADCLQALRDSQLCEIKFSSWRLVKGRGEGDLLARLRQTHPQLLQGLSEAQHLEVFKLTERDNYGRRGLAPLLADAFLRNPAAKTLCILGSVRFNFEELVKQANAQRAENRMNPVELQVASTPAAEEDNDSVDTVESLELDSDDIEADETEEDEMPYIQGWQGRPGHDDLLDDSNE